MAVIFGVCVCGVEPQKIRTGRAQIPKDEQEWESLRIYTRTETALGCASGVTSCKRCVLCPVGPATPAGQWRSREAHVALHPGLGRYSILGATKPTIHSLLKHEGCFPLPPPAAAASSSPHTRVPAPAAAPFLPIPRFPAQRPPEFRSLGVEQSPGRQLSPSFLSSVDSLASFFPVCRRRPRPSWSLLTASRSTTA